VGALITMMEENVLGAIVPAQSVTSYRAKNALITNLSLGNNVYCNAMLDIMRKIIFSAHYAS
jgi:hypothetical protein